MPEPSPPFTPIEHAVEEYRRGRFVIIVDDEDRENEGDLAIAAERVTPEAIAFMAREGRGLVCLALTAERCDQRRPDDVKDYQRYRTAAEQFDRQRAERERRDREILDRLNRGPGNTGNTGR